jgi:hypothetical protein
VERTFGITAVETFRGSTSDSGIGRYAIPVRFRMFVSRPNAGKSTLTKALVGQKIVIASSSHESGGVLSSVDCSLQLAGGAGKPPTLSSLTDEERVGSPPEAAPAIRGEQGRRR